MSFEVAVWLLVEAPVTSLPVVVTLVVSLAVVVAVTLIVPFSDVSVSVVLLVVISESV